MARHRYLLFDPGNPCKQQDAIASIYNLSPLKGRWRQKNCPGALGTAGWRTAQQCKRERTASTSRTDPGKLAPDLHIWMHCGTQCSPLYTRHSTNIIKRIHDSHPFEVVLYNRANYRSHAARIHLGQLKLSPYQLPLPPFYSHSIHPFCVFD